MAADRPHMGHHKRKIRKKNGWDIAVRPLHSILGGPGGLCVTSGDLRGLWVTLSPTHEAWAGVAVLAEVRCHVHIVRKVTGTRRELWIAREVPCPSSDTVSVCSATQMRGARTRSF